jgi:hypothetical protein
MPKPLPIVSWSIRIFVALFVVTAHGAQPIPLDAPSTMSSRASATTIAVALNDSQIARLLELNGLGQGLVAKAATGRTPAHEFRIEAVMYREFLRRLMIDDRTIAHGDRISDDLLVDMVRMSALIHSAAECKTGLVVTCPADLMLQLRAQQRKIDQELKLLGLVDE